MQINLYIFLNAFSGFLLLLFCLTVQKSGSKSLTSFKVDLHKSIETI